MADEKKTVKKEDTSKAEQKINPAKKVGNFFVKIGKAIAKFFKDLRGETKKIVWPGRQMVIKSTGIVLAAILVIGAGIWIIDFAVSGAVNGLSKIADKAQVTETTTEANKEDKEEHDHDHDHDHEDEKATEKTTEKTTEKE
jgi:preprotein translocase subunit SecE